MRPAKTQINLGIRPVLSESSLSAWRKLGFLATHWAHSEDSYQTGRMPRLICVFAGRTVIVLVLSWGGQMLVLFYLILWSLHLCEREPASTCMSTFCGFKVTLALPLWVGWNIVFLNSSKEHMSRLMRLWYFSSSVNSFFKRAFARCLIVFFFFFVVFFLSDTSSLS